MAKEYDYKHYMANYRKQNKPYCFFLHREKDKDIIKWLERQQNQSEAIREALREVRNG